MSGSRAVLTLAEAVLEAAGQVLHVTHATSSGGLASDGLDRPVVCTEETFVSRASHQQFPRCGTQPCSSSTALYLSSLLLWGAN